MSRVFLDECQSVSEYARERGKSRATGYNWVKRGLPVFDALGQMLVHPPTADAWMRENTRSKNTSRRREAEAT
jgi:hypothetical protein